MGWTDIEMVRSMVGLVDSATWAMRTRQRNLTAHNMLCFLHCLESYMSGYLMTLCGYIDHPVAGNLDASVRLLHWPH